MFDMDCASESGVDLGTRGAFSRDRNSHRASEESVARGHKP